MQLALGAKLTVGASICAVETFAGAGAPAAIIFPAVMVVAAPVALPMAPAITGPVSVNGFTISGTAQAATAAAYPTVQVFVCSASAKPAAAPPACDTSSVKLANSVAGAPDSGNYVLADGNGTFAANLASKPVNGQYIWLTEIATPAAGGPLSTVSATATAVGTASQCNPDFSNQPYSDCDLVFSLIGGVEQSAQSSLASETTGFVRAFTRASAIHPSALNIWGVIRLLGAPTTSSTQGVVSVVEDPSGTLTTQTFSTIGTSIDYMAGAEYVLGSNNHTKQYTFSLIAGFGGTTPLQTNTLALAYQAPPFGTVECQQLLSRFSDQFGADHIVAGTSINAASPSCMVNMNSPTATGSGTYTPVTTIGFSNQDRTSFLGKAVFGVRTIDRFLGTGNVACGDADTARRIGPCERGIVDWTIGQDASITGGQMRHFIMKIDAVHPFPVASVNFIYLFGSASIRFSRNTNYAPLILQSASVSTLTGTGAAAIPNASTVVLSLVQPNRDFYRFGVGINVNQIFTKLFTAPKASTTAP